MTLGLQRNPNLIAEIYTSTTDVGHPTDSHPPLGVLLNALQVPAEVFVADAAQCSPLHPAIELIPEHDELEKELSDIESALLAVSMGVSAEAQGETGTSSENVAAPFDGTSADDFAEFIELLSSKQLRIYALSNWDLQSVFWKAVRKDAWTRFSSNSKVLQRWRVTRSEMLFLKRLNTLGNVTDPRSFLFVLKSVRQALQEE